MTPAILRLLFVSLLLAFCAWLSPIPAYAQDEPAIPITGQSNDVIPVPTPEKAEVTGAAPSSLTGQRSTAAPGNDDFDFAAVFPAENTPSIFTDTISVDGATVAFDDPDRVCGSSSNNNSVWYRVTPSVAGLLEIDTSGSTYDTVVAVYTGSRGELTNIACDDDGGVDVASNLTIMTAPGTTYHILVAAYSGPVSADLVFTAAFTPLQAINVPLDIILLQDETGSMRDDISSLQRLAPELWDALSMLATVEFRIGVVGFRDYARMPWGNSPDWVYRQLAAPTSSRDEFQNGLSLLSASGGFDDPEAQFPALYYLASPNPACIDSDGDGDCADAQDTPAGQPPSFRSGAQRIVLLATDNIAHTPENTDGYPGPTQAELIARLVASNITVIGLVPGGSGSLDMIDELVQATGGSVQDTGDSGAEVAMAVINAIQLLRPVSADLSTIAGPSTPVQADLVERAPVIVTLLDTAGRPVAGHSVQLATDRLGFDVVEQPLPTDDNGVAVGYVQSGTPGTATVTATDLNEGVKIAQKAQVIFVGEMVAPNAELAHYISIYQSAVTRALDHVGQITGEVAENGDYFKSQITPDAVRFALGLLFDVINVAEPIQAAYEPFVMSKLGTITAEGFVISSHIRVLKIQGEVAGRLFDFTYSESTTVITQFVVRELAKSGWRYWASELLDDAVEDVVEDKLEEGVTQMMTRNPHSMADAAATFQSRLADLSTHLDELSNQVLIGIPPMSDTRQAAFVDDLRSRAIAALEYVDVYTHQAMLLDQLRMAHDSDSGFAVGTLAFLARFAGKTLASTIWGPVGGFAFEAPLMYIESRQDWKRLETAKRAALIAPALMATGAERAAKIYDTAGAGLEQVLNNLPIRTTTGVIESVRHYEEGVPWYAFWEDKYAYSDVTIRNTSNEAALFTVLTKYSFEDTLFALPYALITLAQEDSIWLEAGETGTVRVEYLDQQFGYPPDRNSDITVIVLGTNSSGTFRIGHDMSEWNPQRVTAFGAASAHDTDLPAFVTPLATYVYQDESDGVYRAELWLNNPFTATFTATVSQALPANLTVLDTDGTVSSDAIVWEREIAARDVMSMTFRFSYSSPAGTIVNLPTAQLQFVEPAVGQLVTTSANPLSFQVPMPLEASLDLAESFFGQSATLTATVRNMSRTVQQPAVRLVLRDHQGQIVFEASRYPSLDAGEQTLLTFAAPGTLWPSWYDMEVWVSLGGDEVLLTSGILKVEGDTLYLPAVRR